MNGQELSKAYFEAYGKDMLAQFPELAGKVAVGLAGAGSECLGFDDELSQDHDFEPGFCLFAFVDEEGDGTEKRLSRREAFALERAYAKLPREFEGFARSRMNPVGGNRRGLVDLSAFLKDAVGTPDGQLSAQDWLRVPEQGLLEVTGGEIWADPGNIFTPVREALAFLPEDVRRKKLAGCLLLMAQAGQYNYPRIIAHGETGAAQMACFAFAENAIHASHLLERRYTPYYKWSFRSLRGLGPFYAELADDLEGLLTSANDPETAESKAFVIEDMASRVIGRLMDEGLTKANCGDLEKHAYSVNDGVADGGLRNMHILSGV
ncbi:MAG: DUF4037 domain-containing protein [Clostridia bacterium]|nr:DUF4037 domain-containing protein [Clostridia bacterium]